MTRKLELADIQGNVIRAYGRFGYPVVRYYFLHVDAANKTKNRAARSFIDAVRKKVTTAERWQRDETPAPGEVPLPPVTLNIGFSWDGLRVLGLPTRTLKAMPDEYIDGMRARAHILGDVNDSGPEKWDPIWTESFRGSDTQVHIWISMNARVGKDFQPVPDLDAQDRWLRGEIAKTNDAVTLLSGHGPTNADYQEARVLLAPGPDGSPMPTSKEHFGFDDGIGNPVFEGQFESDVEAVRVIGRGKLTPDQTWKPIATGEFLLGHVDESQELPPMAAPDDFSRNGTFMVYRKLHENVKAFEDYIAAQAEAYAAIMGVPAAEANETIRAKMAGRWSNGVPLMAAPTYADWQKFNADWRDIGALMMQKMVGPPLSDQKQQRIAEYNRILIDFKYNDDIEGYKCPVSAHIRRANSRDMLDPKINTDEATGSALNKRRRILRRGLPYGTYAPDNPDGEHGIIFMAICASLFRQFEFVQQQWIQYGLDFNVGNDTCPIIGKHEEGDKFVIAADPKTGKPPYLCADLPPFVTTRGGEYFFIPSLTALRLIAMGVIDPT